MWVIYLANKTHTVIRLLGLSATVNVLFNLVLIPRIGIAGAGLATVIAYGVLGLAALGLSRRYIKFDLSLSTMAKSVLAAALMALMLHSLDPTRLGSLLGSIILGTLVYFFVLVFVKGVSTSQLRSLWKLRGTILGARTTRQ